ETLEFLSSLDWPGNVRQLENTCRWLTVMSPGQEIHLEDVPPELKDDSGLTTANSGDWTASLKRWAELKLNKGESNILEQAVPELEKIMIEVALNKTAGRRQEAAKLLGWGRNTLTRKIKELEME
ncbi:MAG: nitrogen regulation protein NR(I), partial [Gammaproteobacteria bacterium]|nr:nitrogen regulation protein NR(I) [Gammaproteobacteria bacterium]